MKIIPLFIVFVILTLPKNLHAQLTNEERQLYNLIMEYRASNGLPKIPLSPSLTFVAQTHVRDLQNNRPDKGNCNLHSWSNQGKWSACCYTPDHRESNCMWNKPRELTFYKGNGYEISYGGGGTVNANGALRGWQNSSGHNTVILNQGIWANHNWQAIGIGIYGGYANVWFGSERDNTSSFDNTQNNNTTNNTNNTNNNETKNQNTRRPARTYKPSVVSYTPAKLYIKNSTQQRIRIFWINMEGQYVHYTDLNPNQQSEQNTYIGHNWAIVAEGSNTPFRFIWTEKAVQRHNITKI